MINFGSGTLILLVFLITFDVSDPSVFVTSYLFRKTAPGGKDFFLQIQILLKIFLFMFNF